MSNTDELQNPSTIVVNGKTYNVNELLSKRGRSILINLGNKHMFESPAVGRPKKFSDDQYVEIAQCSVEELQCKFPGKTDVQLKALRNYARRKTGIK